MLHIDYSAFGFKTMGSGLWEKHYCLKNPACCEEPLHVYSRNIICLQAQFSVCNLDWPLSILF